MISQTTLTPFPHLPYNSNMKKVYEGKSKNEVDLITKTLTDNFFTFDLKSNADNYELFVDDNIFDDALARIKSLKVNLTGKTADNSSSKDKEELEPQEKSFMYFVDKYFKLSYFKLLLISFFYSLITNLILFFIKTIIMNENVINKKSLKITGFFFFATFITSQVILIYTRYHPAINSIKEAFKIRLNNKPDTSGRIFKVVKFLETAILHLVWFIFLFFM